MIRSKPARTPTRRISRILVAGLLVVSEAIGATLGYQLQVSSSSAAAPPIDGPPGEPPDCNHRLVDQREKPHHPSVSPAVRAVVRLARPTVPSLTARRSSTTRFQVWPSSIQRS